MRRAGRRRRGRGRVRLRRAPARLDDGHGADPRRQLVAGARLSPGAQRQRDDVRAVAQAAGRLEVRDGAAGRARGRGHGRVRADVARHADRLARPRRRPLQDDRPDSGPEAGALPAPRRRTARPRSRSPRRTSPHHRRLVAEALALFGARHYDDYHFLLHAQRPRSLQRPRAPRVERQPRRRALAHRTSRRRRSSAPCSRTSTCTPGTASTAGPRASPTPADYQEPMDGDLLWVYEGLTEYLRRRARRAQRPADARSSTGRISRCSRPRWTARPGAPGARSRTRPSAAQLLYDGAGRNGRPGAAASTSTPRAS